MQHSANKQLAKKTKTLEINGMTKEKKTKPKKAVKTPRKKNKHELKMSEIMDNASKKAKDTRFKKGNKAALGNCTPHSDAYWTQERMEEEAQALLSWAENQVFIILSKFALMQGYTVDYLTRLAERCPVFRQTLDKVKLMQEQCFIDGACDKSLDMNFVKYFMPRMLKDKPEWKVSWDSPDTQTQIEAIGTVTINKIVDSSDD